MEDDVATFLARPVRGKLARHADAIIVLRAHGCSLRDIVCFLHQRQVTTTPSELSRFLRRRGRSALVAACAAERPAPPAPPGAPTRLPQFDWPPNKNQ